VVALAVIQSREEKPQTPTKSSGLKAPISVHPALACTATHQEYGA
jgi:hypothetical protein